MAVSSRVRDDAEGTYTIGRPLGTKKDIPYLITKVGKVYKVYEAKDDYSSTTGGMTKRGHVERGTDGKPMQFTTEEEAQAWIDAGLPVD